MRAVIDTNVFVSGVFWKGPPYRILQAWKAKRFQFVISPAILEEYKRVLADLSVQRPGVEYESFLDLLDVSAEMVSASRLMKQVCRDPDDDKFIEAALSGGATYVATGDKALLALNGFRGLQILQPAVFLRRI